MRGGEASRVDGDVADAGALASGKGLTQASRMSLQGRRGRVGATVFHVAPVSRSVSSTVMSRMQAVPSAMHSSQVPEVTSRRYSLPTCTMRVRIRVLSASSAPYRATAAAALAPSSWG